MLDIKYVKENLDEVKKALAKKHTKFDLDKLIQVADKRSELIQKTQNLQSQRNKDSEDKNKTEEGKKIRTELQNLKKELAQVEIEYNKLMLGMHNIPHKNVPHYKDGDKVERTFGEKPKFDFEPKDHLELGESLDIIDVERASKVSGTRMGYLKGKAALLEFALIKWISEQLAKEGFTFLIPPILVRERAMFGTGFFPAEENEFYKAEGEDLFLAGTSEVPLASYFADEILTQKDLPIKFAGFSSCFRKEAGSYGKDTRGIFRVHQFDKIEMFIFSDPEKSWADYEELTKTMEKIFQQLGIHYRLMNMSGGDIGAPNAKKLDLEAWFPAQKQYRELTSCSHDTDFQARRLNIKYQGAGGKDFVHTMNSTAVAIGRTIIAIAENYQQKDGSIKIPKVLIPYCGFDKINKRSK